MTPGDGRDPARADRERAGPSPEDGRAETYLRLCAESELRRALTLPRYEPPAPPGLPAPLRLAAGDRKSTRLNSSHVRISYAVFCLKKKKNNPKLPPHKKKNNHKN